MLSTEDNKSYCTIVLGAAVARTQVLRENYPLLLLHYSISTSH